MNVEHWEDVSRGNETVEGIVNHEAEDAHSGERLLDEHGDAGEAIRQEFGVEPSDERAMLAKFRELSRNADTLGAAQLHNLHRRWQEAEEGKNVPDEE
jgi:hypothetical protein